MSHRLRHGLLALLLACYALLGAAYAAATPLFESPDESSHLQVIRYIRVTRRLPPYQLPARRADSGPNMAWAVGYHDPPLYYAPPLYHVLAALLVGTVEGGAQMADLPERLIPSPSWQAGYAPERGSDSWNKNIFVHLPTETLAESATLRAAAVLRAASIFLGGVTILCTYGIARILFPDRGWLALGAALVLVLNPQFVASHAGVSNDPLTNALFGIALLGVLRLLATRAPWYRWALLGIPIGLGLLTKQSALILLPVCGLAALLSAFEGDALNGTRKDARPSEALLTGMGWGAALGITALLIGGGWYVANFIGNGDLLGTGPHYAAQVPLARFGWTALLGTLQSYWAAFGWALITAPRWIYGVVALIAAVAVAGWLKALSPGGAFRQASWLTRVGLSLLALACILNVVSFTHWAQATGAPYGRLLFPTAGAASVLLVWGLAQWRSAWIWRIVGAAAVPLFLFTLLAPWLLLRPAFANPYCSDGLPARAMPYPEGADAGAVRLLGYMADEEDLAPGDVVHLDLVWAADEAPDAMLTTWVQLGSTDPTQQVAGDSRWLGGTLYPSAHWRAGDTVRHRVALDIPGWAPAPALYWARVGLQDGEGHALRFADGANDYLTLGPWRLRSDDATVPDTATETNLHLGPDIRLIGYEVDDQDTALAVTLHWKAEGVPDADYTVFVHVVDAAGALVAQDDGPPMAGAYPTSWWLPGDLVPDVHTLPLAQPLDGGGALRLHVGLYEPSTGVRLPAFDAEGAPLPEDTVLLELPDRG